jgi:preprotein translocase subunit SecG
MLSIILGVLTFALIVVSIFLILVVLAQKSKADGGVGAAMGGGMAEATFGADTSNVLSKMTIWAAVLFFALSLSLYMGRIYESRADRGGGSLPAITGPVTPAMPATGAALPPAAAPAATTTPAPAVPAPAAK